VLARDPEQRFTGRFELVHTVTRALGFQLYNRNLSWREDPAFIAAWSKFPLADDFISDRRFILHSMARSVADLSGDTAECGVLAGASSFLICSAMEQTTKHHHMFDSFEGLSAPEASDRPSDPLAFKWERGDLSVPMEVTAKNLARFERVHFYPGWIPTRFADVADRRFCFVHVDVDLYQPTYDALAFFYPRLVPGGILLCDDYGFSTCPGARRAFDELAATWPERHVVHLTSGQGFIVKR
jgi:O-methyltransferase